MYDMNSTVVVEGLMVRLQRTELWLDVQFSYYDYCMAFMDTENELGLSWDTGFTGTCHSLGICESKVH
jgi:hypothetical protein